MRVATQRIPGQTVSIRVGVDVGSRFDTFDNNGAANMLAQLSLKVCLCFEDRRECILVSMSRRVGSKSFVFIRAGHDGAPRRTNGPGGRSCGYPTQGDRVT
jgi:hypothetical protein